MSQTSFTCHGITQSNARCKCIVSAGERYCWRHNTAEDVTLGPNVADTTFGFRSIKRTIGSKTKTPKRSLYHPYQTVQTVTPVDSGRANALLRQLHRAYVEELNKLVKPEDFSLKPTVGNQAFGYVTELLIRYSGRENERWNKDFREIVGPDGNLALQGQALDQYWVDRYPPPWESYLVSMLLNLVIVCAPRIDCPPILYRGTLNLTEEYFTQRKTYIPRQLLSTTTDPLVALQFVSQTAPFPIPPDYVHCCLFAFSLPRAFPFLDLVPFSRVGGEEERLLPAITLRRMMTYNVQKVEEKQNVPRSSLKYLQYDVSPNVSQSGLFTGWDNLLQQFIVQADRFVHQQEKVQVKLGSKTYTLKELRYLSSPSDLAVSEKFIAAMSKLRTILQNMPALHQRLWDLLPTINTDKIPVTRNSRGLLVVGPCI